MYLNTKMKITHFIGIFEQNIRGVNDFDFFFNYSNELQGEQQ
jgi:hypothetical protein